MLKAAFAVLLAWNAAGVESAHDEPPTPRVDHAHGPVVKSAKRPRKSRVTPASMEEDEKDAATVTSPEATAKSSKATEAWKTRKPSATSANRPKRKASSAQPDAKTNSTTLPEVEGKQAEPTADEAAKDDDEDKASEETVPGKLPDDVESTAIEPAMEDDAESDIAAGDDDEPTAEPTEEPAQPTEDAAVGDEESPAQEAESSTDDEPTDDAPAEQEPAKVEAVAPPKKVPLRDKPATIAPAKRPKKLPADGAESPPASPAEDSTKPSVTKPAVEKAPAVKPPVVKPAPSASAAAPKIDAQSIRLRDRLRKALATYYQRPVNARDNTPWETFHWVIAYNVYAEILADGPWGRRTNAVGWLCYNRPCHGQYLLALEQGRVKAQYGVGLQGHEGQFLAILAQSRVMIDYPLRVGGGDFKVSDLVRSEMLGCKTGTELTFKLIALSHYLELNSKWQSQDGDNWDIPRLIREELSKPIQGAACGGTHRLMGLSYAVRMRRLRGEPIDGEYRRAEAYVKDYHRYAFSLQNPDGSFSTNWLAGREARPDIDRRLQTTGHILEWMVFSLTDQELRDPRVVKCVKYLTDILLQEPSREWKIGPLGHSLRALTLYDRRVFEPLDDAAEDEAADLVEMDAAEPASPTTAKNGKQPPVHSASKPRVAAKAGETPAVEVKPEETAADSSEQDESDSPATEPATTGDDEADAPAAEKAAEQDCSTEEEAPADEELPPAAEEMTDDENADDAQPTESTKDGDQDVKKSAFQAGQPRGTVQRAVRPPRK